MIKRLHHVGVVTSNIEKSLQFYVTAFGCPDVNIVSVDKPGLKLRTAMIPLGTGTHLQLIEPKIGLGVEELAERGEGAIVEMALEVDDIEAAHDRMREQQMFPVSILGDPLQEKFVRAASGNKYFYLPKAKTRGTSIEFIEVASERK
jgi:catechol 2,3-dioxygenase-like lactoylglutathione lyase family enzyme